MSKPAAAPAPDQAARLLALDPARSVIVQAPAGSGKTGLLTQRYLALLARVAQPESVVAITFTKKAAGEMRDRIAEALELSGQPEPDDPYKQRTWRLARQALDQDRERGWRLMDSPSRMRIDTIDALCLSIARRMPLVSGLGGQPVVTEDADILYGEAATMTVRLVEAAGDVAAAARLLLHHLGNDVERLSGLFAAMLARRDQWLPLFGSEPDPNALRKPLEESLSAVDGLSRSTYTSLEWSLIEALLTLLPHACSHLRQVFARHATIDFIQICLAALSALGEHGNPTDLALSLGERIEHLLVDEAQDISRTHLEVIRRLAASGESDSASGSPRTLFLVGDPMQSIYRFREADVSIFQELRRPGNEFGLEPVTLTANFRSQAGIVDWVNNTFEQLLAGEDDPETGVVGYAPAVATRDRAESPAVLVHPFHGADDMAEAQLVADLAQKAVAAGQTTAILVRSRPRLAKIIPELNSRGIPYTAVELDPLDARPVVSDLTALTRALLHPADRVSWLAVLRAPWCGLTLDDLFEICANNRFAAIPGLLAQPVELASRDLTADGRARLSRVAPILLAALDRVRRVPVRELVEDTWIALGGPQCCGGEEALANARMFFELVSGLGQTGAIGSFAELDAQLAKLFALPDPSAGGQLQVMTIHKAKGLEFDTVILPGLGRGAGRNEKKLLSWTQWRNRTLLAPVPSDWESESEIRDYIEGIEKSRDLQEMRRLLYVAATRAREQLHLIGHNRTNQDGEWRKVNETFLLSPLWTIVQPEFERVRSLPRIASMDEAAPATVIRRVPAAWSPPSVSAPVYGAPEYPVTFEWVRETLRHVGRVVHAWLHRIAVNHAGPAAALPPSLETLRRALAHAGVAEAELDEASQRARHAIEATLRDHRGRWILTRHDHDHREFDLTSLANGAPARSIIDCTFIDNGTRWIIDYKTSLHEGGSLDAFLDNEQERYREQLERYAALMKQLGPEPIRLGLYFPLLQGWREWSASGEFSAPAQMRLF